MTTIFKNGRIFSPADSQGDVPNLLPSMVARDGKVVFVGQESELDPRTFDEATSDVIDLSNRIVLPGFIDGHMHLLLFASSLQKVDLTPCENLNDIREKIKGAAKADSSAPRIFCCSWMPSMTDEKALASMLDDLDERPIFVDAKDLHSTWCNTAALKELKVYDAMPDPEGGVIHRDETGKASGLLSEAANMTLVWPHIANVASMEQKKESMRKAINAYSAAGYTGMIEMAMDDNSWGPLVELLSQDSLPIRIAAHWLISPSNTDEKTLAQVDRAIALHRDFNIYNSANLRIAGIKVICDGVVDSCTAGLSKPYANGITCEPLWRADRLEKVIRKADQAGLQIALHAIGDAAVTLAISSLEAAAKPNGRHRIEHLELTSPGDAKRLAHLGITASIQAVHADPSILRAWPKLLGRERCSRAFAYREFHDEGVNLALGTDAPTAPHFPLPNLYTATTRRSARDPASAETVNEHFALPLASAIAAATAGTAYSCFADERVGSLEVGKQADFVVVEMEMEGGKLLEAEVMETWFDGRRVWEKPG